MKYKHYPLDLSLIEFKNGQKDRYRITTINWTYATEHGKTDYKKVHKNEYIWTLRYLIKWIIETEEVAEEIIKIEKCS